VDVAENFDWRFDIFNHNGLSLEDVEALASQVDDVFFFAGEFGARLVLLVVLRLQQGLHEFAIETLVGVLRYSSSRVLEARPKLLGFLLELVNRDLADQDREVFSWVVHVVLVADCDVGLVGKHKLLLLLDVVNILSWIVLLVALFVSRVLGSLGLVGGLYLHCEVLQLGEELEGVYLGYYIHWDVWGLVLEPSMHVDVLVH